MLSVQGAEVHSLVRELRSHMLHGTAQIQTREKPHDIEFGSYLLAMIPKAKVKVQLHYFANGYLTSPNHFLLFLLSPPYSSSFSSSSPSTTKT